MCASSSSLFKMAEQEGLTLRFVNSTEEERELNLKDRDPKNTAVATDFWVRLFQSYNAQHKAPVDLKTLQKEDMQSWLKKTKARKKDGSHFSKASYFAARSAIQRHIASFRPDLNVFICPEFKRNKNLLGGNLKDNKRIVWKNLLSTRQQYWTATGNV